MDGIGASYDNNSISNLTSYDVHILISAVHSINVTSIRGHCGLSVSILRGLSSHYQAKHE